MAKTLMVLPIGGRGYERITGRFFFVLKGPSARTALRSSRLVPRLGRLKISLVIPAFNEAEAIGPVLERLRADPRTRLQPVVILTSSKEERDIVAGYSLGANSYIRKPVDFDQFVEAVYRSLKPAERTSRQ